MTSCAQDTAPIPSGKELRADARASCYVFSVLPEKPWKLEPTVRLVLTLLICWSFGSILVATLPRFLPGENGDHKLLNLVIAMLTFQGTLFVLLPFFVRSHGIRWSDAFGFNIETGRAVLYGLLAGMAALPIAWALQALSAHIITALNGAPEEQIAIEALRTANSWTYRAALGATAIVVAPATEEFLFRGILYPAFKQCGYPRAALWGTAILFGVVHVNLTTLVPLIFLALVLTLIYEHTRNLLSCIVAHSLFNAANFLMLWHVHWQTPKVME